MPEYIEKVEIWSGDTDAWHPTYRQTTEYSATQLVSSIKFKLSHAISTFLGHSLSMTLFLTLTIFVAAMMNFGLLWSKDPWSIIEIISYYIGKSKRISLCLFLSFQIVPFINFVFEEKNHLNSHKKSWEREFLGGNLNCKCVAPSKTKLFSAVRSQTTGHLYHWCLAANLRIGFYNGEMVFNRLLGIGWSDLDDFFGRPMKFWLRWNSEKISPLAKNMTSVAKKNAKISSLAICVKRRIKSPGKIFQAQKQIAKIFFPIGATRV